MNLYKLKRKDQVQYCEYEAFVVRAEDEKIALDMCKKLASKWCKTKYVTYFTNVEIEILALNVIGKREIVLCDYNAG